ncbi:hypothetical protein [Shinella sp.]|uniref:hypothetical protein n=1 Tax=Shinella sp. TaxID=1870904 RepID=UPI00338F44CA
MSGVNGGVKTGHGAEQKSAVDSQYFMKASPVRPGDYLEFFAEIDLLGAMSACPGGDCSAEHSSDSAACYPLVADIYRAS